MPLRRFNEMHEFVRIFIDQGPQSFDNRVFAPPLVRGEPVCRRGPSSQYDLQEIVCERGQLAFPVNQNAIDT